MDGDIIFGGSTTDPYGPKVSGGARKGIVWGISPCELNASVDPDSNESAVYKNRSLPSGCSEMSVADVVGEKVGIDSGDDLNVTVSFGDAVLGVERSDPSTLEYKDWSPA